MKPRQRTGSLREISCGLSVILLNAGGGLDKVFALSHEADGVPVVLFV